MPKEETMNERLENLIRITPKQIIRFALFFLNVLSLVFTIVYSVLHKADAVSSAFGVLLIVTLVLNLLYATVMKRNVGFWFIVFYGIAMLAEYFLGTLMYASNVAQSANVAGSVIVLIMLLAALFLYAKEATSAEGKRITPHGFMKFLRVALTVAGAVGLILFCILTFDAVYNFGESVHEYTTTRAEFLIAFAVGVILCLLIRITLTEGSGNLKEKFMKSWAFLLIVLGLGGFALSNYAKQMISLVGDIEAADTAFSKAFGADALEGTSEMRAVKYSAADRLFGIPTGGFHVVRDTVYAVNDKGMTLRYDAYVPDDENAHKSVIVSMHGYGGDKDLGNNTHRSKYFASKGYVVFDIQYGTYNEQNLGVPAPEDWEDEFYGLENIDAFFRYAVENDRSGANFGSVFLTGYSMGGRYAINYGLNYSNKTEEYGVKIRGLIPCYPSSNANSFEGVDSDSPPMLMLMGLNDGYVYVNALELAEISYREAGNPNYAGIGVSYSGHGCDGSMVSRANQLFLYYMERFLYRFR